MKGYVFAKVVQVTALLVFAFVVLRIIGPWLVNLHNTPALILAAALVLGGALLFIWVAWTLIRNFKNRIDPNA